MQIQVEVVYASAKKVFVYSLSIEAGTSVLEAIKVSGMLELTSAIFPEKNQLSSRVGIFGKTVSLKATLKSGDRIEIYRDLVQDPKEARRVKANTEKKLQKAQRLSSKKR